MNSVDQLGLGDCSNEGGLGEALDELLTARRSANKSGLDGTDDCVIRVIRVVDGVYHGLGDRGGPEEGRRVGHRPDGGRHGPLGKGAHQAVRRGLVGDGGVRVRDGGGQGSHALNAGRNSTHVELAGSCGDGMHLGEHLWGRGCQRQSRQTK